MLTLGWLFVALAVVAMLSAWVTFTTTRLSRLYARVDAAAATLDAQLVRRAAALQRMPEHDAGDTDTGDADTGDSTTGDSTTGDSTIGDAARVALAASGLGHERSAIENAVGRAVVEVSAMRAFRSETDAARELHEAATRVVVARRFYNDAVRDTRTLRARALPRALHAVASIGSAGRELPCFFDIDDTPPGSAAPAPHPLTAPDVTAPQITASRIITKDHR